MRLGRVFLGFFVLWLLLDRSAAMLESMRGEWGVAIAAMVVIAAVLVEFLISKRKPIAALKALGLRKPNVGALMWTLVLCAALLCVFPAYSMMTGEEIRVRPDAAVLALGMFAQGGIAEETVFRGFLFRHVREGRPFWRAALIASVPFIAVHALLFLTMAFPVALMALLVSLSISFPLAWLYERSGNSIWPPAILHAVVQGAIKVVETENFAALAAAWMVVATLAPWVLFFLKAEQPPHPVSWPLPPKGGEG
ncbi:MAG: CPBP family intramembrane metalloprotease [Hyphomonadaceae bacterium]|nr:CPBP family intramembrane metalloprotease [Hyphomonadaceae bacterium]